MHTLELTGKHAFHGGIGHMELLNEKLCALLLTQVSKNFSDVFQELVPSGKGQLIMKRAEVAVSAIGALCVLYSSGTGGAGHC